MTVEAGWDEWWTKMESGGSWVERFPSRCSSRRFVRRLGKSVLLRCLHKRWRSHPILVAHVRRITVRCVWRIAVVSVLTVR